MVPIRKAWKSYTTTDGDSLYAYDIIYADTRNKAKVKACQNYCCDYIEVVVRRYKEYDQIMYLGKYCDKDSAKQHKEYILESIRKQTLVDKHPKRKCYIWSDEWSAYWGKNYSGYVSVANKHNRAGVYTIKDAWEHTSHCGPEKRIKFILKEKQMKLVRKECEEETVYYEDIIWANNYVIGVHEEVINLGEYPKGVDYQIFTNSDITMHNILDPDPDIDFVVKSEEHLLDYFIEVNVCFSGDEAQKKLIEMTNKYWKK